MYSFELNNKAPNQKFSTVVEGFLFDIELHTAYDMLFATISVNGKTVKTSVRCIPFGWLIPYLAYAPDGCGNFRFETRDGEYPSYNDFNSSCRLIYYSRSEIENL
jgi:hypothetical protein